MQRAIIYFILAILLSVLFLWTPSAYASLDFSSSKTSLTDTEELELNTNLSLQGQSNKIYYLEGAFKKTDGSNYFGLTFNDTDWVKYTSSSFVSLKKVITDSEGKWNGNLRVKIDPQSNLFTGSGEYILQVKRFTETGSSSWSDNSIALSVSGTAPVATSSPSSPSSSSTPAPSESASQKIFNIELNTSSTDSNKSLTSNIQITKLQPKTNYYLKGAFFKDGSTNYFGFTKVNGSWVKNSQTFSSQYSISTDDSGSWSGSLEIMPDAEDSGFTGSGNYSFKIGHYSSSGSSLTWSNIQPVTINFIPLETDSDASSSPKASSASSTTKPSLTSSLNSSIVKLPKLTQNIEATDSSSSPKLSAAVADQKIAKGNSSPNWFMVGGGIISLGVSSAAFLKMRKKG